MCGIAGAVALSDGARPDPGAVQRMLDALAYRGPDGEGLWVAPSGRAVLGHRRLAVIDLQGGAQPMEAGDRPTAVTLNGEIYNFVELRHELADGAVPFRTRSDTEVLLRLLMNRGPAALQRVRGMFAFAMWDDREGTLLLARDRMGEKPVFYAEQGGVLYFASSLAALACGGVRPGRVAMESLDAFFDLGFAPAPSTMYENISRLPAGHMLTVDGGALAVNEFWSPNSCAVTVPATRSEALDELERLTAEAVRIQLRSDVPLGVFLSGGIDSSLIAALTSRHIGRDLRTFSVRFANSVEDESVYAARVAAHLGSVHEELTVESSMMNLLGPLTQQFGEPIGQSSQLPAYALAQLARPYITVALGGDGGDEAFAGYDWYRAVLRLQSRGKLLPAPLLRAAAATAALSQHPVAKRLRRGLSRLAAGGADSFALARLLADDSEVRGLYDGTLAESRRKRRLGLDAIRQAYLGATTGDPVRRMRAADMGTYLADGLLPKVDVATMAHALELRAPLLDVRVVEFALSLPGRWLVDRTTGKTLLRELTYRLVPRGLVDRPKQGFNVPLHQWFTDRSTGLAERLQKSEPLRASGWFRPEGIERLIQEERAGTRDHQQRLFALLSLDEWLRQNPSVLS